ncbi:6-pyruvoyl-tetrahydropterin synthase-related protein [Patescibacteria group bacterium]
MKSIKKLFKFNWPILIIFLVSAFILRSFVKPGFPETHDGQLYLARFANFYLSLKDGHFPVRWAPNLNYKFGYPIFNFNYYTPYLLGLVPKVLGFTLEASFKLVIFLSFFTGGLFWYLFFRKKISPQAGLISALIYLTAPYQMIDILVRCSIGEIVALGVLPFMLWSLDRFITKPNRLNFFINTSGLAFFALTHNIIFFFSIPVLVLFSFIVACRQKKLSLKKLTPIILSFALAAGLTLFFWAPALLEKKYTNIDLLDQMSFEYMDHFPTFKQLIYSPWGYGYSFKGIVDKMSFQLGPAHWIISLLSIGFIIFNYLKRKKLNIYASFFILLFIGSIFFLLPISLPIWKVLPLVNYVQFPWRLLTFATLASAGLAGFLAKKLPKLSWLLVAVSLVYISFLAKPAGWFNWNDHFWYEYPFNTSIMGANTPRWFNDTQNIELKPGHFFDLNGISSFNEISWKTQEHVYEIDTSHDTEVLERTAYFPGWEVSIDGVKTPIDYQKNDYPGIITFKVSAGKHKIVTKFTENTPARIFGDTVSIASLILFFILLKSNWYFKKK